MPTAARGEGLYVGFEVSADRSVRRYLQGLPDGMGEPLDPSQLSITAMYPEELADRALSRDERRCLPGLVRKIQREVSHIAVVGSMLEPNQDALVLHKNHVAIPVDPSDELSAARESISAAVSDRMGIRVPNYNRQGWYVAVSRKHGRGKRIPPYKKPFPTLMVGGVSIAIRSPGGQLIKDVRPYLNVPGHVGRR